MLEKAKTWLRLVTDDYDEEILQLIDACKIDLEMAGVVVIDDSDPIIWNAIKLYLKANFGYNDGDNKWFKAYEFQKAALALDREHNHA